MRRVLIIQMGRDMRLLRYMKFLKEFGWKATYLNAGGGTALESFDDYLKDVEVIRVSANPLPKDALPAFFKLRKHLFIPEFNYFWIVKAFRMARDLLERRRYDLIFTSTPYSNIVVGYYLKQRYGLPWVVDYTDPWTNNFVYYKPPNRLVEAYDKHLEHKFTSPADFVLAVNEFQTDYLVGSIGIDRKKVDDIPLGYVNEDFRRARKVNEKKEKMVFLHLGVFYNEYSLNFFKVLRTCMKESPEMKKDIEVLFLGNVLEPKKQELIGLGMGDTIRFFGHVPFYSAMGWIQYSDVNIILTGDEKTKPLMTTKITEYLRAGKMILAVVPKGSFLDGILLRTKSGAVVEPHDLKGIKKLVLELYKEYKEHGTVHVHPDGAEVAKFDARHITGNLVKIFDRLCNK